MERTVPKSGEAVDVGDKMPDTITRVRRCHSLSRLGSVYAMMILYPNLRTIVIQSKISFGCAFRCKTLVPGRSHMMELTTERLAW
jgi:hypothetical protein